MQSIFESIESYCITRDFKYEQYLDISKEHSKAKPASRGMYIALSRVFFDEMARDFEENNLDRLPILDRRPVDPYNRYSP